MFEFIHFFSPLQLSFSYISTFILALMYNPPMEVFYD
nr:MAG TPA: hypothetical protein [Caudoviricetes sp.]